MAEGNFKARLNKLQEELKAPKNLTNTFGKYNYRNAEGILEAVKPLLVKYELLLNISDDVAVFGERYYMKAIATVSDTKSDESIIVTAFAREALDKKGMDDSQISGAASSYARKYALNGLFLLDDTKDADTDEFHNQSDNKGEKDDVKEEQAFNEQVQKDLAKKATEEQIKSITSLCKKHKIRMDDLLAANQITLDTMTKGYATNLLMSFKKKYGDE